MITLTRGNLLEASTEALVNTVNTVGVMGKGIALQFKRAFPDNYEAYRWACERGEVRPGEMFVFETGWATPPRYIVKAEEKVVSTSAEAASALRAWTERKAHLFREEDHVEIAWGQLRDEGWLVAA